MSWSEWKKRVCQLCLGLFLVAVTHFLMYTGRLHLQYSCCCCQPSTTIGWPWTVKVEEGKSGVTEMGIKTQRWMMVAAGWQMHGSSFQYKQTHCEYLYGRYLGALWEMSLSRWACHFLVGETSLLELSLWGCRALKYWCIVGAGVYCREW